MGLRTGTGTVIASGVAAALCLTTTAGAQGLTPLSPAPGAASLGDRLYPGLGNGGYDVSDYSLRLRHSTSEIGAPMTGSVTIRARATQDLSRLNLDFAGEGVTTVTVNGQEALWSRHGEELVVTPPRPLVSGEVFRVRVTGFSATPAIPDPDALFVGPFIATPDGSVTTAQPDGAHALFPCNDHPSDPASFTVRFDVPEGTTAVANGRLVHRSTVDGRAVWVYRQHEPMTTELIQLAVGAFDVVDSPAHGRIHRRDVTPSRLTDSLGMVTTATPAHLRWMEGQIGPYPFEVYGSLVVDAGLRYALETQTLPLYDRTLFESSPALWNSVMVHELAHHWFGNRKVIREWSDLWLSEGHATWYEFTYAEEHGLLADPQYLGMADLASLMRTLYEYSNFWRARYGPVARPFGGSTVDLFSVNTYYGGAMVLYALRQEVGERVFRRIERAWATGQVDDPGSTSDFVALASRVAGRDLSPFLSAWLYDQTVPAMPGHPDWVARPVLARGASLDAVDVPTEFAPREEPSAGKRLTDLLATRTRH